MTEGFTGNGQRDLENLENEVSSNDRTTAPGGRRQLTPQQKKILVVALVVHTIVASLTLRDLRLRPDAGVRGPKLFWRAWAMLNTTGSVAYWLYGRRPLAGTSG